MTVIYPNLHYNEVCYIKGLCCIFYKLRKTRNGSIIPDCFHLQEQAYL